MALTYRPVGPVATAMFLMSVVTPWPAAAQQPEIVNLYASAGMNQPRGSSETLDNKAGIHVISPQGTLLKFIPIPEDLITNNAFGGADMKTLYVTAGKTLYKLRTEIAGLPR